MANNEIVWQPNDVWEHSKTDSKIVISNIDKFGIHYFSLVNGSKYRHTISHKVFRIAFDLGEIVNLSEQRRQNKKRIEIWKSL